MYIYSDCIVHSHACACDTYLLGHIGHVPAEKPRLQVGMKASAFMWGWSV